MGLAIRHTALLVTAIMNFIVVVLALFVLKALRSRRIRGAARNYTHMLTSGKPGAKCSLRRAAAAGSRKA